MIHRALTYGWPTLLVVAACVGLAAANWVRLPFGPALAVALSLALAGVHEGRRRVRLGLVAGALCLAAAGWGGLRLDALDHSVLEARIGETAVARVVVTAPPRRMRFAIRAFGVVRRFGGDDLHERVLLELPAGRAPPQGAVLELRARPVAPRGPETGFDERAWLELHGIHVVLRGRGWRVVGRRGGIGGVADRLRAHVARTLELGTSGEPGAVAAGVVLGADEGLDEELRAAFRASGLYHLLAVSGQNVALIAGGVLYAAWVAGCSRVLAEVLAIGAIGAYALAVGWQPSVVRATVAGVLASLAWLASRPLDRWHFLALGAFVLLAWTPAALFDPGFQLSFAAVAGIFVLVPRLLALLAGTPIPSPVAAPLAVSVACSLATAPILWLRFGAVPVWGVLANALAEPAVPVLLGSGLAAATLEPLSPEAAAALAWVAGRCAAWLALCARGVAGLPHAEVSSGVAAAALAAAAAGVLGWTRLRPEARRAVLAGATAIVGLGLAAWWAFAPSGRWPPPAGLRVTFLDVGQGDAVLLEVPEGAILVDQGPPEAHVARTLIRAGIGSLSAIVLTHPQRDHVGGAEEALHHLRVGAVLDGAPAVTGPERDAALTAAVERGVPVRTARAGQALGLGRLRLRVLWPDGPGSPADDPNDLAVVLLASYGQVDVLLTADAETDVTRRLRLGAVEVLKVAHHGSEDPGLAAQLRVLRPRIAVVSVGQGNDYGHPRAETLQALEAVPGLRLYRTDRHGNVVVESDGQALSVRPERGVP